MQDRNRYKYLYANTKRIAQISDPDKSLTENQKKRLPEDKSFMCNSKGKLTTKFKPKEATNPSRVAETLNTENGDYNQLSSIATNSVITSPTNQKL